MEHEVVDKAREVKKAGNIYIPGEPKVAFVMRICGIIIKLNKVTKNLLRITAPTSPEACLSSCCVPRTSLNTPTCDWRKYNHYGEDGDFGNRKEKINELIKRMVYLSDT
ncbi:uncharacterized protein LOC119766475 [Culex quinquefasciatus]|uniref:uncharacterized protein LOC119766475 n=1 Tax=Culex quinquefasciatus TaxID=7176 RepID=UPI0018E3263B|nr:uncharacterized protein LOC119766475 [Culex quinquefasciatus]